MWLYMKHMKHMKHIHVGAARDVLWSSDHRIKILDRINFGRCSYTSNFLLWFSCGFEPERSSVCRMCDLHYQYNQCSICFNLFQLFDVPGCAFVQRNLPHRRDCHRQTASGVFMLERPTLPIVAVLRVHRCEEDPRPRRVPIRRATIGEEVFRGPDVWCVCYEQLSIVDRHWCVRVVRRARRTYRY
jgi:hypothetical protein